MLNKNRIGINYTAFPVHDKIFVINKILFIVGNLLLFLCDNLLCDIVAIVVMCVPIVKKSVVSLFEKCCDTQAWVMLSAALLLVVTEHIHSAVMMLVALHIFDFPIYCFYTHIIERFYKSSMSFENPIEYRYDDNGNYILSNNEFVPTVGKVVSGEALIDMSLLYGDEVAVQPARAGEILLPGYRVASGNIIFSSVENDKVPLREHIITACRDTVNDESNSRLIIFSRVMRTVISVAFLVTAAVMLLFDFSFDITNAVITIASLGCWTTTLLFTDAVNIVSALKLHSNGIFHLTKQNDADSVLTAEALINGAKSKNFSYFSVVADENEAKRIIADTQKVKRTVIKFIYIFFIMNLAMIAVSAVMKTAFPTLLFMPFCALAMVITAGI